MNKELKRQFILSCAILGMVISTMFLWYDNFIFHTYRNVNDYQYCFRGENESVLIDGYEFYKNDQYERYGKARIIPVQDNFLLKGDHVTVTFELTSSQNETYLFQQEFDIRVDNEVYTLDEVDNHENLSSKDFSSFSLRFQIQRKKKIIYDEKIPMSNQQLIVYSGENKDYTIQEIYASPSWLKTGLFSSTIEGIEKDYPNMFIDYLYLKDTSQPDDINSYERFAFVKGKTKDMLDGLLQTVVYYDDEGSLLDKELCCVVTLIKDEEKQDVYTFIINLHKTTKAVNTNE